MPSIATGYTPMNAASPMIVMRRQPVRDALLRSLAETTERRKKLRHRPRVPAVGCCVLRPQRIGLQLVAASVFQEEHTERLLRQLSERTRRGYEDAEGGQTD